MHSENGNRPRRALIAGLAVAALLAAVVPVAQARMENRTDRIGQAHMHDYTVTEERTVAANGAVDELIRDHYVAWLNLLTQATHRADADQPFHP